MRDDGNKSTARRLCLGAEICQGFFSIHNIVQVLTIQDFQGIILETECFGTQN